jgi:hypothetical protein
MSLNIFVLDFLKQFDNCDEMILQWESKGNQKKLRKMMKGTKTKDPLKPKRGKSGFLHFCEEQRPLLLYNSEGIKRTIKEIGYELGKLWQEKKLNGEVDKYEDEAKKDRDRYKVEKEKYDLQKKLSRKTLNKATTAVMKKKETAFDKFVKIKKPLLIKKFPEKNNEEIHGLLQKKWERLSQTKQSSYLID